MCVVCDFFAIIQHVFIIQIKYDIDGNIVDHRFEDPIYPLEGDGSESWKKYTRNSTGSKLQIGVDRGDLSSYYLLDSCIVENNKVLIHYTISFPRKIHLLWKNTVSLHFSYDDYGKRHCYIECDGCRNIKVDDSGTNVHCWIDM